MKTRMFGLILVSLFTLSAIDLSASHDNGNPGNGSIKIIKGDIVDFDGNGTWDYLTFTVMGSPWAQVTVVDLLDMDNSELSNKPRIMRYVDRGSTSYCVWLGDGGIAGDFKTRIHLTKGRIASSLASSLDGRISISAAGPSDGDPEETMIIIKWP